ncbi:hypothetical protein [uncultured Ruminococcus sp.]|uniref:hypothetical protein n=1 Tax=uncultured Ruminococcus sp. TaxID=165186 RepID=UPI0025E7C7AC|nr:hypothetical protein [uncultured Ruminococcus sp.]
MRKLNKVTTVKNDTIETYNHCSRNCNSCSNSCPCGYNPGASSSTKDNNAYNSSRSVWSGTYRK